MNKVILFVLIGGCLATPIQQEGRQFRDEIRNPDGSVVGKYGIQDPSGALRIYKYTTGKDGIIGQSDGIPIMQPIVWNQDQPIIVEPAPLTYGTRISERDQQRHINLDEAVEAREDVSEELNPVDDGKVDQDERKDDVDGKVEDQRVGEQQSAGGPSFYAVKGGRKQVFTTDNEQVFPQVVSGQRRLVEPQLHYAVKGRALRPAVIGIGSPVIGKQHVIYQTQQHGLPIAIEEHRVSPQGAKRQVIKYELNPSQNVPFVPREWLRRPVQQSGVKGRNVQYLYQTVGQPVVQPVIPANLQVVQRQPVVYQPLEQVLTVPGVQDQRQQQFTVADLRKEVPLGHQSTHGGHIESGHTGPHHGPSHTGPHYEPSHTGPHYEPSHSHDGHYPSHKPGGHGGQDQHHHQQHHPKSDDLSLKQQSGVKSPIVSHIDQRVVESVRHVPLVSGQKVVGYQLIGSQGQPIQHQYFIQQHQQPQEQQLQQQIPVPNQQQVYYINPVPDIQQYYPVIQGSPVQSYPQIDNQFISYNTQPLQYGSQEEQYVNNVQGLSGVQEGQVDQEVPVRSVQGVQVAQGVHVTQGVQNIHLQDDLSVNNRGQNVKVDQRSQQKPTFLVQGVKGGVSV